MTGNSDPSQPAFVPGLELNRGFYEQAVRPILERHFPGLAYSAALIGFGSDVLGFDTPMSRDHMWGPRLQLFLPLEDFERLRLEVDQVLRQELPVAYGGYPTHFSRPDQEGVRLAQRVDHGPVDHLIEIDTIPAYFRRELGIDPNAAIRPVDWLSFQEHRLLSLTGGAVFHDGLDLEPVRRRFRYYPRDVWLYLLSAQWMLISQEEPFLGRTGEAGDDLGSRLVTARLAERVMRLCFLIEKRYAPYSKWFGTAFRRLACYPQIGPPLERALAAGEWREREHWFVQAVQAAAELHNSLCITPPIPAEVSPFHNRPFLVLHSEVFAEACRAAIQDDGLRRLPPYAGSVNQFLVPSSDVLQDVELCRRVACALFDAPGEEPGLPHPNPSNQDP